MSYAFVYDVPGDEQIYQRVKSELGDETPKGLVVQIVVKREGGLRHIGVWESQDLFDRFQQERVGPAVGRVVASIGLTEPPARPPVEEMDLVDVITPA
jgi:hypothetical protein